MSFKVINSNIFPLPGNPHMLHLGTIGHGLREYIVMRCIRAPWVGGEQYVGHTYIEEAVLNSADFTGDVYGHCKFIDDDNLAEDLIRFAEEQKLTDVERTTGQIYETGNARWLVKERDLSKS